MVQKYCRTCHSAKDLSCFWIAPETGRAKISGTATSCIQCHEEGRVANGYGPHCEWATPQALDAWMASL